MNCFPICRAYALALAVFLVPHVALAQSSIFESLDQRIDFTESFDQPDYEDTLESEEFESGGVIKLFGDPLTEEDVSKLSSIFQVGFKSSVFFTNNALNAASGKQSDTYGVFEFSTAFTQEIVDKELYATLFGGVQATRYRRFTSQDSDIALGGFKLKRLFGDALSGHLTYAGTSVQSRGFTGQVVAFHTFSAGLEHNHSFGEDVAPGKKAWDLTIEAALSRALANPSDFEFYRAQVSGKLTSNLSKKLKASVQLSLRYTDYDDFFEAVNSEDRKDLQTQLKAAITYQISPKISANAFIGYTDNDSSLSQSNYEILDGGVGGSLGFEVVAEF